METEQNQSSMIYYTNSIIKSTKKSVRKIIKPKKSSNLVRSVINASKLGDISKYSGLRKNEGVKNSAYVTKEDLDANSSTYDSNFDLKSKAGKEDPNIIKNLIGFDVRSNFHFRNDETPLGTEYGADNDSIILGAEKLSLNGDVYKFFMTNENLADDLKNSEIYGSHSLICADGNFMYEKADLKEGEYIFDDCIKILNFIAEGAQAKIYLGLIEEIDKYVAIKRMNVRYDTVLLDKIENECEMIKYLEHPNILKYFDIEVTAEADEEDSDDVPPTMCKIDIIMEYIEGLNLKELLQKERIIPLEKIRLITQKILDGLLYLHENKIIHRDLKPENVIVNSDLSEIKIVDFGISTKVKEFETYRQRSVLGTPFYMAPEIILEKPYSYEVDIWSLGCIVYELVSGIKPYHDITNPFNAMYKMAQYTSPLEYADEHIKDIFYDKSNRALLDFLQKCWRPNNSFRPSAQELLEHKFIQS